MSFRHRLGIADLEPAFFHFRPLAAEVAGIERDSQSGQRFVRLRGRQRFGRPPKSRNVLFRIFVLRELQRKNVLGIPIRHDLRGVVIDLD